MSATATPTASVCVRQMQASRPRPLQHVELMAKREDLELERGASPDNVAEHRKDGNQDGRHRDQSLFGSVGKFNTINTYGVFSRHRYLGLSSCSDACERQRESRKRDNPHRLRRHNWIKSGRPYLMGSPRVCN